MELSTWIWMGVVIGGLGFYYWYSFARHGGMEGYQKHQLQLKEGESLLKFFFGSYHLKKEKKDLALAIVNVERVGKALQIGITDQGRLILKENGTVLADEPVSLEKEQISQVQLSSEEFGGLVGLTGRIEKMLTVSIHLKDDHQIEIDTAKSCAQAILEWSKKEEKREGYDFK